MANDSRLTWMDEEEQRADNNLQNGQTENTHAPVLKKVVKKHQSGKQEVFTFKMIFGMISKI